MAKLKYHVTKEGLADTCNAKERACPLGGEHEEFTSLKDAQKWAEEVVAKEQGSSVSVSLTSFGVVPTKDQTTKYSIHPRSDYDSKNHIDPIVGMKAVFTDAEGVRHIVTVAKPNGHSGGFPIGVFNDGLRWGRLDDIVELCDEPSWYDIKKDSGDYYEE